MSTGSKVIAQTGRQTHRQTHTQTDTHTDTMKTLPLPHTREVITMGTSKSLAILQKKYVMFNCMIVIKDN